MIECILEKLAKHAVDTPDRLAVVFPDEEVSYGELWHSVLKTASFYLRSGIRKGDRIVAKGEFSKTFAVSNYASWLTGAVFVPLDEKANQDTIDSVCKKLNARYFDRITDCECVDSYSFPETDSVANIMFTTGTTGNPKGVVWTHKNIVANCIARSELYGFDENISGLSFVPLNHAAPLWKMYAIHYFGGNCVLLNGMSNLGQVYDFMGKYKVNSFYSSPAGVSVIQSLASEIFSDYATQLKSITISSSALNDVQKAFVLKVLPDTKILFAYGSSEGGSNTYFYLNEVDKPVNCVGKHFRGVEIKIVDSSMKEVLPCKIGTLLIKSDMTFKRYFDNDDLTEKSFYNGYYVSSDTGYKDTEGYVYITGRTDDIINVGGLKVFPSEIENEALKIAGIKNCICIPVDDRITKQAVCLLIQKEDCEMDLSEVRKLLSEKLDSYKVPKIIEFTDKIETTSNGKPDRKKQVIKRREN